MKKLLFLVLLFVSFSGFSQDTIATTRVKEFIGKEIWVKGTIASVKPATEENNVVYINVDKEFPNNVFTIVITTKYLLRLKLDLVKAKGKKISVKGIITAKGNETPQIYNPVQVKIK